MTNFTKPAVPIVLADVDAYGTRTVLFTDDISATTDYILIDLSDTSGYKHSAGDWIHVLWFEFDVDSDNPANFVVDIGFLENVDATNGDFYSIMRLSGTKTVGKSLHKVFNLYPEGIRCSSSYHTGPITANDTAFQTDVNLASTIDPSTADTPSGDGDLVLRCTRTAGSVNLSMTVGYHTHT